MAPSTWLVQPSLAFSVEQVVQTAELPSVFLQLGVGCGLARVLRREIRANLVQPHFASWFDLEKFSVIHQGPLLAIYQGFDLPGNSKQGILLIMIPTYNSGTRSFFQKIYIAVTEP
jgi:hypothetical protein